MDTDSAHFLVKHKILQENVSHHLKPFFSDNLTNTLKVDPKCLAYVSMNKGNIWQKNATDCITKVMTNIHMKGLNATFQKEYLESNIDPKSSLSWLTIYSLNHLIS